MIGLFDKFALKDVQLKNRIGVSPMCQYSATDGLPNEWHFAHLASLTHGGAGLVIAEAIAVSPERPVPLFTAPAYSACSTAPLTPTRCRRRLRPAGRAV